MLKATENRRNLYCYKSDGWSALVARWDGSDLVMGIKAARLDEDEKADLVAFIQAGPPRRWKITRTFDFKPTLVQGLVNGVENECTLVTLSDSHIEEV